jgi:hypothetical protein
MGVTPGVTLDVLLDTARWLADALGHPLPGQVARAGAFPLR